MKPILDAYPEAARTVDGAGRLPLQIALIHGATTDVVNMLVSAYPKALTYPLLSTIPEVLICRSALAGFLPFHMACSSNCSVDVLFGMLHRCPGAIDGYTIAATSEFSDQK